MGKARRMNMSLRGNASSCGIPAAMHLRVIIVQSAERITLRKRRSEPYTMKKAEIFESPLFCAI